MSRSPSIPRELVSELIRLNRQGLGRRRIAQEMERWGVWTTKSSVDRLLKGLPPYKEAWLQAKAESDAVFLEQHFEPMGDGLRYEGETKV